MKVLITISILLISILCKAQSGTINDSTIKKMLLVTTSDNAKLSINRNATVFTLSKTDTVQCYFLEVLDTVILSTKWQKGFVVRNNGRVSFGRTHVSKEYLPITAGIVTSELFYEDRRKVQNQSLQVITPNP